MPTEINTASGSRYGELAPPAALAPYVECCWWSEAGAAPGVRRVLPDGCVDILFSSGNHEPPALSVVGLMTVHRDVITLPNQSFFGLRFRPGMASLFFPEVAHLTDKVEPLCELRRQHTTELFEQLTESTSLPAKVIAVERYLHRPAKKRPSASRAFDLMTNTDFCMERISASAGISTRHLRRLSLASTGVSPKLLARILRFRRAASRISPAAVDRNQGGWAGFAVECGYYDQAHLIREFQAFSGSAPGRFLQYQANNAS